MSGTAVTADLASALAAAHSAVDAMQAAPVDPYTDAGVLEAWRELERLARRLPTVEAGLVREAEARGLPLAAGCRTTASFLRGLLRLTPQEAHARAEAADAIAPRRSLTGRPSPPFYPAVAEAQAAGEISPRHAAVITTTLEKLPGISVAECAQVERDLVGYAHRFDPTGVSKLAAHLRDCLDPDGTLTDSDRRERDRGLSLRRRTDGSGTLTGELTAECAERLAVVFDALAAPKPDTDGTLDLRDPAQRRHDAFLDALALVQRSGQLPKTQGASATIVVTMTTEQYLTGQGLARTAHGALVPTREALGWAGADHRVLAVVLDSIQGVTHYSSLQRTLTEPQRLALYARDGGCTFPGCDVPPQWTEAHHLLDHAEGGPTSTCNTALVCKYHHRQSIPQGWQPELINGRVGWRPPPHIDPDQEPRFNELHDLGRGDCPRNGVCGLTRQPVRLAGRRGDDRDTAGYGSEEKAGADG